MKTHLDRLPDVPMPEVSTGRHPQRPEVVSYSDDRRTRGLRAMSEITGAAGEAVVAELREVAPDLADSPRWAMRLRSSRCTSAARSRSAAARRRSSR
jgi:hypothetical protein